MENTNNTISSLPAEISRVGFGSWALGGDYWGPQEHKDSVRAIHMALRLGVNHFDTAPVYGKGRSEQLLGQQLKKIREQCIIGTKAFYTDPEQLRKSLEISLKRLFTDYIDIFYIHWPLSGADMRPGMALLEELRREGRIRAIGVSNFSIPQIRMVQEAGHVDVYQGGYSALWPFPEEEILPFCRKEGIPFIPYGVLGQGLLTERGLEKLQSPQEGFRHKMLLYRPEYREPLKLILGEILEACINAGWKMTHGAAVFAMKQTGCPSVLLGARSRAQAEENFSLPADPLPPSLEKVFLEAGRRVRAFLPIENNMFGHES